MTKTSLKSADKRVLQEKGQSFCRTCLKNGRFSGMIYYVKCFFTHHIERNSDDAYLDDRRRVLEKHFTLEKMGFYISNGFNVKVSFDGS